MFHYLKWEIKNFWNIKLLKNEYFWIKISYSGHKTEWDFFLYPILDQNHNTMYYLAFDDEKQLDLFNLLVKISGIWPKIANYISTFYDIEEIDNAIKNNDIKFFQQISWIGPKTAKKILIELKDKISISDLEKIDESEKMKSDIIKAVVSLWYSKTKVESFLKDYKWDFTDKQKVIQELIRSI